jgi:hypothetical protein
MPVKISRSAVAGLVVVVLLALGAYAVRRTSHDQAATVVPSGTVDLAGLPSGWTRMDVVEDSAEQPPRIPQLPIGGRRSAYQAPEMSGVWRVVAVTDFPNTAMVGLPGIGVDPPKDWAYGDRVLMTEADQTLYLSSHRPDGAIWFLAVTGGTPTDRMSLMRRLTDLNVAPASSG